MILKKNFLRLMNNSVFGETIENVRKYRNIKLFTTKRRRNYLVSEKNYHTTKFFTENLSKIEIKKRQIPKNKPVNLRFSILELSKRLMFEFGMIMLNGNIVKKKNCVIWI